MYVKIYGEKTWVPDDDTPCASFPDAWSDSKEWKNKEQQKLCLKMCQVDCPFVNECLLETLKLERGLKETARRKNGIRGGMTPSQRLRLVSSK